MHATHKFTLNNRTSISVIKISSFQPARLLANTHVQTLWPFIFRPRHHPPVTHERLELPDGDFVDLVWTEAPKNSPIVVVLHGLEGSYRSHYIPGLLHYLQRSGFRCVVMHFRGCGGEPNRLDRAYHSGDTEDVAYLTQVLQMREPQVPLFAVGISLGGNVLLKWLGQTGETNPLQAAVAVSVPFLLHVAADTLNRGIAKIYQRYLLRNLINSYHLKFSGRVAPLDLQRVANIKTIREFDDLVTAPLHGFDDADHYYAVASSRQYLKTITKPTLIIHAKDDPFMTSRAVPSTDEISPSTVLELSEQGGHVGFVAGSPLKPSYTLDTRIRDFLVTQLQDQRGCTP